MNEKINQSIQIDNSPQTIISESKGACNALRLHIRWNALITEP